MSSAYDVTGGSTFYRPASRQIRDIWWPRTQAARLHQRLFDRKRQHHIPVRQESTINVRDASLNSYLVAPQYLNEQATQALTRTPPAQSAVMKKPPVYQYSRITRTDPTPALSQRQKTAVAGGITSLVAVAAHGFTTIRHAITQGFAAVRERLHYRGKTLHYSVGEGAAFSWWFGKTKTWARVAIPVLAAVIIFGGILYSSRQGRQPFQPQTVAAQQGSSAQNGASTTARNAAHDTQASNSPTSSNTPASAASTTPPNSAVGVSSVAAPSVTSPVGNTSGVVGGMGGGPSTPTPTVPGPTGTTPTPTPTPQPVVSVPQLIDTTTVSVPPQTVQVQGTPVATTPSVGLTVN
jgi:hypothetical protein